MTNIKLWLLAGLAVLCVGLVFLGITNRKVKLLISQLLEARARIAELPLEIKKMDLGREIKLIDVKRKNDVNKFNDLLKSYVDSQP